MTLQICKVLIFLLVALNIFSCYSDDDLEAADNIRNYYQGSVVDRNGNPLAGRTVVLSSGLQQIAKFITDENGKYEGAGVLYGPFFNLTLLNNVVPINGDGDEITVNRDFVAYFLSYTESIQGEVIELPDLISTEVSLVNINILNNSGNAIDINYTFVSADCNKVLEDDAEVAGSYCYMVTSLSLTRVEDTRDFRLFVASNSSIVVSATDGATHTTETFFINESVQNETFTFN